MSTPMLERVLNADTLPSLPVVAIKVLALTEQEDVSAGDIADVIEKDPALTARILKVANSSLFGLSKTVASVQQATIVLGLRTIKVMALSFSLVDTFTSEKPGGFDFQLYWRRSLTTAVMAKLIADGPAAARRDEAFVGGLLCDIGMMAAHRGAPKEYAKVLAARAASSVPIQQAEQQVLGVTHAEISAELLRKWNLPALICDAVGGHHDPDPSPPTERTQALGATLWAASEIADVFCGDIATAELDAVTERCAKIAGADVESLKTIMEALNTQLNETANLFSVNIGQSVSYQELRDRAVAQLAVISVSAEHERAQAAHQVQQAQSQLKDLERQATTDKLTGIANRAAFETRINEAVEAAQQSQGSVGLIMMDLDHFKKLNDTHGHQAGDEALRRVGRLLKKISEGPQLAARYGGEEFAVIVAETTARALRELAEDIRKNIAKIRFEHNGQELSVTASLGAAHVSYEYEVASPKEVIERADECLYDAKNGGRNRVEITF